MMKMLIGIDEERVEKDKLYDLEGMWELIGKTFFEYGFTAERQEDGSVMYTPSKKCEYLTAIWLAIDFLEEQPWFAQYCTKWILYDNHSGNADALPFSGEDVLKQERFENPLFRNAIK